MVISPLKKIKMKHLDGNGTKPESSFCVGSTPRAGMHREGSGKGVEIWEAAVKGMQASGLLP